jgi:hypothetical protein
VTTPDPIGELLVAMAPKLRQYAYELLEEILQEKARAGSAPVAEEPPPSAAPAEEASTETPSSEGDDVADAAGDESPAPPPAAAPAPDPVADLLGRLHLEPVANTVATIKGWISDHFA